MKQLKTMTAVAFAALISLASCSKNDNNGIGNGTQSVKVQVSYAQPALGSRAEGAAVTGNLQPKPGHIFLTDGSGMIYTHVGIGTAGTPSTAGEVQILLSDLTSGEAVIEGVSGQVTKCYIVMNDVAAGLNTTGITGNLKHGNISTVLAYTTQVGNLNNAAGDVENLLLYGDGDVDNTSGTTSGDKDYSASVSVDIEALASRIQIGKLSAQSYTPDGTSDVYAITDFTVEGIFINNFYATMDVSSTLADLTDGGTDGDNYSATATTYATGVGAKLWDNLSTLTPSSLAVTPATAAKPYWAYNVFPSTTVPNIVVRLSGIEYTVNGGAAQTISGERFLTINSFKKAGTVETINEFVATNTYTLSDIQFNYSHMAAVPYEEMNDVLVEVTMMPWEDNSIEWNN